MGTVLQPSAVLCPYTRHSQANILAPSRPRGEAGQARGVRNAGWGAWRSGHIPGETLGLGGQVCATRRPITLGAAEEHPHQLSPSPLLEDWLAGGEPGLGQEQGRVMGLPEQSSGPETQSTGKACLRGAEHRELEGGRAGHLEKGLCRLSARVDSGGPER